MEAQVSREFTDWIKTLDELEPKGVQQETRLAPVCLASPVSRFSFSLAVVWIVGFYLMAAVCVGLVLYDLWLVFVS